MLLHTLGAPKGSNKEGKRKGRGNGSGLGKTAGRGQKGAGARKSANKGRMWLEGGNFPLWRATPKRGFKSHFAKDTQVVNLQKIALLQITEITPEVLVASGLIKTANKPVKILAYGDISKAVTVKASAFSSAAKAAIEKAGGKAEVI